MAVRHRSVGWFAAGALCAVLMGGCSSDSPTPSGTGGGSSPQALTEQNARAAIAAHELSGSNFDDVNVSLRSGGQVVVVATTKQSTSLGAAELVNAEALDALSVADAVSEFSGVSLIHVQLDTRFTDAKGAVRVEPAAWIEMTAATLGSLKLGTELSALQHQPSQLYTKAAAYDIVPTVWYGVPAGTLGGLTNNAAGHPLVTPLPN